VNTPLSHRLRSVDALRALAVLPVVLFHLNPAWLPGGYLGVDIFFVISGFLITGIILREVEEGTFSFTGFYARRIRRILPALFVMMAAVTVIFAWRDPLHLNELVRQVKAVVILAGNYAVRDLAGDYWGASAQAQPLLHTWSLAVEEQFYLLFPFLIWLCCRKRSQWGLGWWVGGAATFSLLWYAAQSIAAPVSAFYLLGGRAWELLAGALVASLARNPEFRSAPSAWRGWTGLACVAAAYVLPWLSPDAQPILPLIVTMGTALFLSSAHASSSAHEWLSRPGLVYVGLISYSLYLWHWPAIVLLRLQGGDATPARGLILVLAAGIFLVAAASYHWVEKPLRTWRPAVWLALACAPLLFFGVQALGDAAGRPVLAASANPSAEKADAWVGGFRGMTVRGPLYSSNPREIGSHDGRLSAVKFLRRPSPVDVETVPTGGLPGATRRVLVWGDSHAMMLAPVSDEALLRADCAAEFHVLDGADPAVWRTQRFGRQPAFQLLRRSFRDDSIATSDELDRFERAGLGLLQRRPSACLVILRYDHRQFEQLEPSFREMLRHSRLIVVQQPPRLDMPDFCTVDYFAFLRDRRGVSLPDLAVHESPQAHASRVRFEGRLLDCFGGDPNFSFVRTEDLFTQPDGGVRWWDGAGALYYIDDNHLSEFGAGLVAPRLEAAVRKALAR
jgi:peptidoglycan/LPS O-acetylase OafA/YrhL